MNDKQATAVSKRMSLALRHDPGKFGLVLDSAGWTTVEELLAGLRGDGLKVDLDQLLAVVRSNDKQRFALSDDGLRIRANQGHSIEVELEYAPAEPPDRLYHGTAWKSLPSIRREGLTKQKRHAVHLSSDVETAVKVGQRHGKPVVLTVRSDLMRQQGFVFYVSTNQVWLTETAPAAFLEFPPEAEAEAAE